MCICDGCEKFSCCYCDCCYGCDSCSRKCCGCAFCTICSICGGLISLYFLLFLIAVLVSKDDDDNYIKENSDICHNIKFKPKNIECNNNNILYIDLSLEAEGANSFNTYRINLYKNYNIQNIYDKNQFLLNYLQGNVFSFEDIEVSFFVEPGEYSLEFIDESCKETSFENIYIPPYQSSCHSEIIIPSTQTIKENEDQIFEQEIEILVESFIPEFVIIMDISGSMGNLVKKYINIIIPEVLSNLNYQLKPITLITFSGNSNSYNYNIDQFKSSNINSGGTTLVSGAFEKLIIYFSQFSKKNSLRILTISDGQIFDKENAINIINEIYSTYYGQFPINSRCVRVGNDDPDTRIFLNILRLIYPSTPTEILNIAKTEANNEIIKKITKMFENDGIGNILWINSDIKNIRENPYSDYTDEVPFINDGRKFIILKKKDGNDILYIKDINGNILRTIKAKYNGGNNDDNFISQGFNNYSNSLIQKYFYNKINNSNQAILENEKIKKFFEDTEGSSSEKKFCSKINTITDLSNFSDEQLKDFINNIIKD